MLKADNGQILYCACLMVNGVPKKEYYHANDQAHAMNIIRVVYPNRNQVLIIAVAPAVGVFAADAEDKHGKIYTVN